MPTETARIVSLRAGTDQGMLFTDRVREGIQGVFRERCWYPLRHVSFGSISERTETEKENWHTYYKKPRGLSRPSWPIRWHHAAECPTLPVLREIGRIREASQTCCLPPQLACQYAAVCLALLLSQESGSIWQALTTPLQLHQITKLPPYDLLQRISRNALAEDHPTSGNLMPR